ncbi:MAG TPA: glycosyltransferase family 9 protein [Actinomycetales bacterium]|nr:glycosyltransferase family 9 protein [Actinomycetales bacterium]
MTVLVLRALGLGDALTGVAPLRGVRRRFPQERLVLAATSEIGSLLRSFGVIDDVLPHSGLGLLDPAALAVKGLQDGGHVAVNLHGRGPQSHRVLQATRPAQLIAFGSAEAGHDGPAWLPHEHEVDRWCRLVGSAGGECGRSDLLLGDAPEPLVHQGESLRDAVVLHPGAASGSRRWPADRWAEVARVLSSRGERVVVTGVESEQSLTASVASPVPEVLDLGGRLTLAQMDALVANARLLLSGDTGVAHVATARRTPSVVLFGPTPPSQWGPAVDPHLHTLIWRDVPGAPADPHSDELDARLSAVVVDEVVVAACELLATLPAVPTRLVNR